MDRTLRLFLAFFLLAPVIALAQISGSRGLNINNATTSAPGVVELTKDLGGTATAPTVLGIDGVPLCTGFTGTNLYTLTYTTASSPNPCWTMTNYVPSSGGTLTGALGKTSATFSDTDTFTNPSTYGYTTALLNGINPATEFAIEEGAGNYSVMAMIAGEAVPSTSTDYQAQALAAFTTNNSPTTNVVAGYFQTRCIQTGVGACWGINPTVNDNVNSVGATLFAEEADTTVLEASPSTVVGITSAGGFPVGTHIGDAFRVNLYPGGAGGNWNIGFATMDGSAASAFVAGAASSVAGASASQPVWFVSKNSGNTDIYSDIYTDSSGDFIVFPYSGLEILSGKFVPWQIQTPSVIVTALATPSGPPTSTGATSGGTVGVSGYNYASCQAIDPAGNHSAPTALSSAVTTITADQTIPWTCPVVSGAASYVFGFCQGSSCTQNYYTTSATKTFTQSAAASTYTSGTLPSGNTTGNLQVNGNLNGISPTTLGYVDPTSSIQTQLNSKATCTAGTSGSDCLTLSSGYVPAANLSPANQPVVTTTVSSGSIAAVTTNNTYIICTTTCNVTPLTPAAGVQLCARNAPGSATVITLNAISSGYYELTTHAGWGTETHTLVSGGLSTDSICLVGYDSSHYAVMSYTGTWTD
jgi:hypothetical protein